MKKLTFALVLALALSTTSCNSLFMAGGLKTNLIVKDLKIVSVSRFPPDQVVAFEVKVRNKKIPGTLVAGTSKLRVVAQIRIEDPKTFDPANPPPIPLDANGNPLAGPAMSPMRFTLANLVQPTSPPNSPPVVTPGDRKLVVDLKAVNGKALLAGDVVTFQATGFVWNPWPNPGERRVYLEVWVTRNGKSGDHDMSDNFMIVPLYPVF